MDGAELNAIYNGYSYMPFYLGHSHATFFEHLYDFEPASMNHSVPHYGLFARWYFGRQMKNNFKTAKKYSSFTKTSGPPYNHFNPLYDPLEHNEYLLQKGVDVDVLRSIHTKGEVTTA